MSEERVDECMRNWKPSLGLEYTIFYGFDRCPNCGKTAKIYKKYEWNEGECRYVLTHNILECPHCGWQQIVA